MRGLSCTLFPLLRLVRSSLVALSLSVTGAMAAECRQALALGLDVSLSVDAKDFILQRDGLARALLEPAVMSALQPIAGTYVELAVYEWSGQYDQRVIVDWTRIDGPEVLIDLANTLRTSPQMARTGRTALGSALLYGADMLRQRAHCAKRTLDISGDGKNNNGTPPEQVTAAVAGQGITVNGLVIGFKPGEVFFGEADVVTLTRYFAENVITGPQAFVESVAGFENYKSAMVRKLLRELAFAHVQLHPPQELEPEVPPLRAGLNR